MAGLVTRRSTGSKHTASAASSGRSSTNSPKRRYPYFALCIDNAGHERSLAVGRVYQVMRPLPQDRRGDLRVIDEEGEDYLYPARRFVPVELPKSARMAVMAIPTALHGRR